MTLTLIKRQKALTRHWEPLAAAVKSLIALETHLIHEISWVRQAPAFSALAFAAAMRNRNRKRKNPNAVTMKIIGKSRWGTSLATQGNPSASGRSLKNTNVILIARKTKARSPTLAITRQICTGSLKPPKCAPNTEPIIAPQKDKA
jgi:hypothetical protein